MQRGRREQQSIGSDLDLASRRSAFSVSRDVCPRCVLAHRTWCVATSHCAPGERSAAAPLSPWTPYTRSPRATPSAAVMRLRHHPRRVLSPAPCGGVVPPPTVTRRILRGPVPRIPARRRGMTTPWWYPERGGNSESRAMRTTRRHFGTSARNPPELSLLVISERVAACFLYRPKLPSEAETTKQAFLSRLRQIRGRTTDESSRFLPSSVFRLPIARK
jgi:hypothetical protein